MALATLLLSGASGLVVALRPTLNTVRVELLAPEQGSKFQIFYNIGRDFNEDDSSSADYVRSDTLQTLFLERPAGRVQNVRLDPLSRPGVVRIRSIAVGHRPLWGLGPVRIARVWNAEEIHRSLDTHLEVESVALAGGMVTIKSTGVDPRLFSRRGTDLPAGGGAGAFDLASRVRMKLFDAALLCGATLLVFAGCSGVAFLLLSRPWLLHQAARMRAQTAFIWLALPFGLFFVFLTPPLQAPDEQIHLFRSYQIATLGAFKPDVVPEGLLRFWLIYKPLIFHPETKTGTREILEGFSTGVDPAKTTKYYTTNLVLPYLPQALGVLGGKALSGSPLVMMLLGRLFNLAAYLILVYAAIRVTPVFKWTLLLIALMPICVFLAGSLSYDPPTIGAVLLFVAAVLRFSREDGPPLDRGQVRLLFLLAWFTAVMKLPYCLVVVSFLLLPVGTLGTLKRYWLVFSALIVSTLLMTQALALAQAAAAALGFIHPDGAPSGTADNLDQLFWLMGSPHLFAKTFLDTLRQYWQYWLETMIGSKLGWLDTDLPLWVVWSFSVALPALALVDSDTTIRLQWYRRLLLLGVAGAGCMLIPILIYLFDSRANPIGAPVILGVQGRYFIPFLPCALLVLSTRALAARDTRLRGAVGLVAVSVASSGLVAATVSLLRRYYG